MNSLARAIVGIMLTLSILFVGVVYAQDYSIDWYTLDGGGMWATGGEFELSGTIGQPDARNHPEPMTGGRYILTGGFWVIPECQAHPVDYDNDCDVDQGDFALFEACVSGPTVPYIGNCGDMDFDTDTDVDQKDFGIFQRCVSGDGNPADPTCAD